MTSSMLRAGPVVPVVSCQVRGHAVVPMSPEQLPLLRRNPGPSLRQAGSAALLKHADAQTVAGVAAVLEAMQAHSLSECCFREWGAIAGPSLIGRQASAEALERFRGEGAFAISPHLPAHESLHSVSGTISQALGLHGPNFGVGGGPEAAEEALLVAATLLADAALPGLWVVLTEFDPELIPASPGQVDAPAGWICHALALALTASPASSSASSESERLCLHIGMGGPAPAGDLAPFRLEEFGAALTSGAAPHAWRFRSGGRLSLDRWDSGGDLR